LCYPFDFQTYEDADLQRAELYGIDDDGTKIKMQNKGFTSSAFGKMKFQKVDSMLNFESSVPSAMQKKWQRNLQIKEGTMSSKPNKKFKQEHISDKEARRLVNKIKLKHLQETKQKFQHLCKKSKHINIPSQPTLTHE
jgi:hypothetical protein